MKDYVAWQADQAAYDADDCEYIVTCETCRESFPITVFRSDSDEHKVECENCGKSWTEYVDMEELNF